MITESKLITLLYTLIIELWYLLLYYNVNDLLIIVAIVTTVNVYLLSDDYCTLYGFLLLSIHIWTMSHMASSCTVLQE